ncbi:hypothetical protein YA0089_27935 [Pseudomonas viridiflava]|uniref:hypothetical protein n=1 Tax=Pseudomonas viridiflava TaxID=33069 RepID=UPI0018E5D9CF|nr:hypothetical protein [Pseudomonas viridiflava]MBI6727452.1 hypothetical protein [Pseudomonas viridiflava]
MSHVIVYTLISQGGGVDGRDHTAKGGDLVGAYLDEAQAKNAKNAPWCKMVPEAVDMAQAKLAALAKLNPLDRLALGL